MLTPRLPRREETLSLALETTPWVHLKWAAMSEESPV